MDKAKAKEIYESSLAAGYPAEAAKARTFKYLKTGEIEVDPTDQVWTRQIKQESGGNQDAVSPKGATGIAQVMPTTGPEAAKLAGLEWDPVAFRKDKGYNEAIGRAYMRKQFEDFGNARHALMAYNAGPERTRKILAGDASIPEETRNYVQKIAGDTPVAEDNPRDKAKAIYDEMVAKGAPPDEIKMAIGKALGREPKTAPAPVASPEPQQAPVQADPAAQQDPSLGDNIYSYLRDDVRSKMDRGHEVGAGSNSTILDTVQGVRKLYNQATGDDAAVKRIEGQNQQERDYWEQKDPTGSGPSMADAGKMLGNTGQFMAGPGGIVGGALTGAAQGVTRPTTAADSQLSNAAIGGALGGALPAMGTAARKLIGTADPAKKGAADLLRSRGVDVPGSADYKSPLGNMLSKGAGETGQDMAPALTKEISRLVGAPDLSNDVLENTLKSVGAKIGDNYKGLSAEAGLPFAKAVNDLRTNYLRNGLNASETDGVPMAAKDLLTRAAAGPIDGEMAQALRSQLGSLATKGTSQEKVGYKGLQRALDDLLEPELQAAGRSGVKEGLNSQYRMAKLLRAGKGIPADGVTPGALSNKIETAINKGAVNDELRTFLHAAAEVAPKARLGADASDEGIQRLLDRPQGLVSALMRIVPAIGNAGMKTGKAQALVNSKAAGTVTKEGVRNALLPILLRLNEGE